MKALSVCITAVPALVFATFHQATAAPIAGVTVTAFNLLGNDINYGARLTNGVKSLNTGIDGDDWDGGAQLGGASVGVNKNSIIAEFDLQAEYTLDQIDVSYMSAVGFAVPKPGLINVWFSNTAGTFDVTPDIAYDSASDVNFPESPGVWVTTKDAPMAVSGSGRYLKMEFVPGIWSGNGQQEWIALTEVVFNGQLVPEPSGIALMSIATLGLVGLKRRRKQSVR